MEKISDNSVINSLGIVHLGFRIAVLLSLAFLYWSGGYDPIEFSILFFSLLPISVVYITSFIRFWLKYPYTVTSIWIVRRRYTAELVFFIAAYTASLAFIWLNPWYKDSLPFEHYKWGLLILELLNAVFVATRLAYLFRIRES